MWNAIKRLFGFGDNSAEVQRKVETTPIRTLTTSEVDVDTIDNVEELNIDLINAKMRTKRNFNPKQYYRKGTRYYKRGGVGEEEFEILDIILLEILLESFNDGDIEDWEAPAPVEDILDVDVDTIPVETSVDVPSTRNDVSYVATAPATEACAEPEPERASSYGSGSSSYDSGSSGSSSDDSGSSDCGGSDD